MRLAVFDLGTNVFNLLIAHVSKNSCTVKKVIKIGTHIGKWGLNGTFPQEAINESVEAIGEMMKQIETEGGADIIKAFATSAVRDSANGTNLTGAIKETFGIEVEIISGDREAELIYKGVRESLFLYDEKIIILDIGGGSNEFIIADKDNIYWKESFPLGVIRIREMLKPSDPIDIKQIKQYKDYLDSSLTTLFHQASIHKPRLMIGCSGSFDTLRELIYPDDDGFLPARELPLNKFWEIHGKLLVSTREERMQMAGMSPMRVDYMVLGSIFVEYIIAGLDIKELYQSSYSLKEGYMAEVASQII